MARIQRFVSKDLRGFRPLGRLRFRGGRDSLPGRRDRRLPELTALGASRKRPYARPGSRVASGQIIGRYQGAGEDHKIEAVSGALRRYHHPTSADRTGAAGRAKGNVP